jgi:hypothetical protein
MRLIKLGLLSIFFLLLLVTIIGLLFPSHVRISKAIDMTHPSDSVRQMIVDTASWNRWHPTFMAGSPFLSQTAAYYHLISNSDSLIRMNVNYGKRTVQYGWQFYRYPGSEKYTLQWWADFELGWLPWERMGSLFYEKTYGAMMEQGLKNLDSVLTVTQNDTLNDQPPPIHYPGW